MKRRQFKEEQIIAILKQAEQGVPVKELCRKHGIAGPTLYRWKAKFGGVSFLQQFLTLKLRSLNL